MYNVHITYQVLCKSNSKQRERVNRERALQTLFLLRTWGREEMSVIALKQNTHCKGNPDTIGNDDWVIQIQQRNNDSFVLYPSRI